MKNNFLFMFSCTIVQSFDKNLRFSGTDFKEISFIEASVYLRNSQVQLQLVVAIVNECIRKLKRTKVLDFHIIALSL